MAEVSQQLAQKGDSQPSLLAREGNQLKAKSAMANLRMRATVLPIAIAIANAPTASLAQPTNPDADDEIVVTAPRTVPIPLDRNPYSGAPIVVTTVKISCLPRRP